MFSRILSGMLLVSGIVLFSFGNYKNQQLERGEQKLSQVEENAQKGQRPVLGPVRRNARSQMNQNAQEKIGDQKQKIAASQVSVYWLHATGIVLFITGTGLLAFSFYKNAKNR